jgi:hypothetical protein
LPVEEHKRFLAASLKFIRIIERMAKPRGRDWLRFAGARVGNAGVMGLMGVLLILPFPPLIFFTNSLPSYAVILVAASMMEEDGLLIWFGYGVALLSTVYIYWLMHGGLKFAILFVERLLGWFSSTL